MEPQQAQQTQRRGGAKRGRGVEEARSAGTAVSGSSGGSNGSGIIRKSSGAEGKAGAGSGEVGEEGSGEAGGGAGAKASTTKAALIEGIVAVIEGGGTEADAEEKIKAVVIKGGKAALDEPLTRNRLTLLVLTCLYGRSDIGTLLLRKGASPDAIACGTYTALYLACQLGSTDLVGMLLTNGAAVDGSPSTTNGYTPLHVASGYGFTGVSKLLIEAGANLNALSKDGITPLTMAKTPGSGELVFPPVLP